MKIPTNPSLRKNHGVTDDTLANATPTEHQALLPSHRGAAEDRLLTLVEVAEILGHISTRSVRRIIARGELPQPIKILSTPRLFYSEVTAYLERLKLSRNKSPRRVKGPL